MHRDVQGDRKGRQKYKTGWCLETGGWLVRALCAMDVEACSRVRHRRSVVQITTASSSSSSGEHTVFKDVSASVGY
jgi:hypothetical protein